MTEQTDEYDAVAEGVWKRALWVMEDPANRWKGGEEWSDANDSKPEPAPYEPSGYAKLDAVVAALKPRFKYGGNQPQNEVNAAWMDMRPIAISLDMDEMPDLEGAVTINMPHKDKFRDPQYYAATIAHELFHWVEQHDPRAPISMGIQRKANGEPEADPAYIMEEIAAEIGCVFLLHACDVPFDEDERGQYVAGYLNGVPPVYRGIAKEQAVLRAFKVLATAKAKANL